jgi:hypothetical protein
MINSSFIIMLNKFSPKEIREFSDFLASPFFNKNKNLAKFYNYIKKFYPDFNNKKLEKKYIYRKLFSKRKYNDGFMRTIIFNMGKLAEDYLAYVNFSRNTDNGNINLLNELNNRKLDKLFLKCYKETESKINKSNLRSKDYFHKKYLAGELMHLYYNWRRYKLKDFKDYEADLVTGKIKNSTLSYMLAVLKDYRVLLWKMESEKIDVNTDFLDILLDFIGNDIEQYDEAPAVELYYYMILLMKEKKINYFYILKDMLLNHAGRYSHDERYSLHNQLQDFAVKQIFAGNKSMVTERFMLYKAALSQGLYKGSDDIYFDDILFGIIAFQSAAINEFEWTENFIENYKHLLAPDNYNVVVNSSLAKLYITKGEYSKALDYLNEIKNVKHIQYKTPVKDLMLMVFYELSMFSQAYYQLDSYRHFIVKYKNSFPKQRAERIINFTKFYTRLLKIKENFNQQNLEALINDLNNTTNILNRNWLLQKSRQINKY